MALVKSQGLGVFRKKVGVNNMYTTKITSDGVDYIFISFERNDGVICTAKVSEAAMSAYNNKQYKELEISECREDSETAEEAAAWERDPFYSIHKKPAEKQATECDWE